MTATTACRSCKAEIWWGTTEKGKPCPYDVDLEGNRTSQSHFVSCPDAGAWSKGRTPDEALAWQQDSPTALATLPETPPATLIRPIASGSEARAAWDQFQNLKRDLLEDEDVQDAQGRRFLKRSGYLKLAAAFGLTVQIVSTERDVLLDGDGRAYALWRCVARAIAPNGREMQAVGACASNERRFAHKDADPYATAQTRATNRAIANLIGGGEVSAEELEPPEMTVAQATALVATFFNHLQERDAPLPNEQTIMVALVLTKGDLRLAWRYLTTGKTERIVPSD